jgi:hypothetical protein
VSGRRLGSWLNGLAALLGGVLLGFGGGRFVHHPSPAYGMLALIGVLVLWYAISDYRKAQSANPESETHGRTVE